MRTRTIRIIAALLAVLMLLTACGSKSGKDRDKDRDRDKDKGNQSSQNSSGPVTLAQPIDLSRAFALPDNVMPDLYHWADGAATYDDEPGELGGNQVLEYRTDREVIDDYIDMLQNNGFTLVDEYDEFVELHAWGLTCDAAPQARTLEMMFTDTPCHVSIHWTDSSRRGFTMYVSPDIQVCDTGLRKDGSVADITPQGLSAGAGLIQVGDSTYQTSDGRLTASVGTAMVIRDGVTYNTNARYVLDGDYDHFWIEDYYRNEVIFIASPANYLMEGDFFRRDDLVRWRPIERSRDSLDGFIYDSTAIAITHDDTCVGPGMNEENYEALTLRLMHYDKGGIAVFYVYARFLDGTPGEIEALCAVDTGNKGGAIEEATYLKPGSTLVLKYTHQEYGSSYHTYDWEIVEGDDKVSIDATGNTCNVTALSPGVATITVSYGYSREEPDVLTGIPRTVGHTIVETYHIIVE